MVNASTIKPLDGNVLSSISDSKIFTLEEHVLSGGFGSAVLEWYAQHNVCADIVTLGVEDRFVQHGDHKHLLMEVGLDDENIYQTVHKHLMEASV